MSTIFNSRVSLVPAIIFVPALDICKPIDETLSRLIYNENTN